MVQYIDREDWKIAMDMSLDYTDFYIPFHCKLSSIHMSVGFWLVQTLAILRTVEVLGMSTPVSHVTTWEIHSLLILVS